ncbi:MAG TPA: orotate phosphoribosyltransferase [Thermoanaerobaculia bacterium]|nr:orotate phosphoribosyltransferase [Thermoanaerobaculia bacterium]
MPLDVLALLSKTGALLQGHYRLSSGLHSPTYVQCALLLQHPRNAKPIGESLAKLVRPMKPQKIVSPALGGMIIGYTVAEALDVPMVFTERNDGRMTLRRGFKISEGERVVMVEDVVTTGRSTREAADVVAAHGGLVFGFASILNRSGRENPFGKPYESLLTIALKTWDEASCPLCAKGVPPDTPGSRHGRAVTGR